MSISENKALIRQFYDSIYANDLDPLLREVLAEDDRLHFDSVPTLDRDEAAGFLGAFGGISGHSSQDRGPGR